MRYAIIGILFALASCFNGIDQPLVQGPGVKKQKQKISYLQKRLQAAEKEKEKAESEIEKLMREIDVAELALIRKKVNEYELAKEKPPQLFMEERESLYRLIQSGPSSQAFEAQVELDRILRMITEFSDEEKYVY